MARVNVDQVALTDGRFARLAQLRGWADADHARGKMLLIWNETIHRGAELQVWLVEHHLGAGAAGDLLEVGLADLVVLAGALAGVPAGGTIIRIKGCAGRSDYLERKLNTAIAGGKARAANAQRTAGRFTSKAHQPLAGDDTSAPAPAPAPAPAHSEAKRKKAKDPEPEISIPDDWTPTPEHHELALERGVEIAMEVRRFKAHADTHARKCARWNGAFTTWLLKAHPDRPNQGGLPFAAVRASKPL